LDDGRLRYTTLGKLGGGPVVNDEPDLRHNADSPKAATLTDCKVGQPGGDGLISAPGLAGLAAEHALFGLGCCDLMLW
jgi:hypothetical protein